MTRRKDDKTAKILAKSIKKYRSKIFPGWGGKTRAAEKFGTSPTLWSRWEAGAVTPNDPTQRKLATFFGVTLAVFRGDHEKPPTGEPGAEGLIDDLKVAGDAFAASRRLLAAMAAVLAANAHGMSYRRTAQAFDSAVQILASALESPPAREDAPPAPPASRSEPRPRHRSGS